jgi:hypothetical protein
MSHLFSGLCRVCFGFSVVFSILPQPVFETYKLLSFYANLRSLSIQSAAARTRGMGEGSAAVCIF